METIKIKPSHESQGDHVIINKSDFDPDVHELLDGQKAPPPAKTRDGLDKALAGLPGDQIDPEYVVNSLRRHFGDLFTDADEAIVRERVIAPGQTAAQLKAALDAKGIPYKGNASKADLQALLDAAPKE